MNEPSIPRGTLIGRTYRVENLLGQGGMGEVYSAVGPSGETVALKVLHERAQQDRDLVARFQRESEIAAQVKSPYVAGIVGAGKERDGRLWIAFEKLEGEGLDTRLKREQYLAFADVACIVRDTLLGLEAAHAAGVVHRDIKPANLFIETLANANGTAALSRSGQSRVMGFPAAERTRILDFGVSKLGKGGKDKNEPSLTAVDATLGSFAYMAPEQVRGSARCDARADLYAVGAVCFRALAGRLPFEGINAIMLLALKMERNPPTLKSVTGDDWPAIAEQFLQRIMARNREERYPDARTASSAWQQVCAVMPGTGVERRSLPAEGEIDDEEQASASVNTYVDAGSDA
jgi:eukaryotic-like serine/threonine-protein kinase